MHDAPPTWRALVRRDLLNLRVRLWQLRRWWRAQFAPRPSSNLRYVGIARSRRSQAEGKRLAAQALRRSRTQTIFSSEPLRRAVEHKAALSDMLLPQSEFALPADLVGLGHCSVCARHIKGAELRTLRHATGSSIIVWARAVCPNGHPARRQIGVYSERDARRERPDEWLRRMLGPFPTRTGYQGPPPLLAPRVPHKYGRR